MFIQKSKTNPQNMEDGGGERYNLKASKGNSTGQVGRPVIHLE